MTQGGGQRGRAADERYLEMVAMRCEGIAPQKIADALGVSLSSVKNATLAVRRADEAEAAKGGEDTSGCYWPERGRRGELIA